ncbi:MAG TPA: hypothetical protein VI685_29525 [Candidatus Angelobacter sp.]
MNCKQFQEVLPHIIESGGNPDQERHLKSCNECSELVRDLRYIAEQARLLLPMHDPNPRVWNNIQKSLAREGLVSEGRMSRQGHILKNSSPQKKSWTPLGAALAAIAVLALAVLLVNYRPTTSPAQESLNTPASDSSVAMANTDDQMLISQVSQQDADAAKAFRAGLEEVNSYISEAQKAVNDDPEDSAAQVHLQDAYEQKAMLYQMATTRSLE